LSPKWLKAVEIEGNFNGPAVDIVIHQRTLPMKPQILSWFNLYFLHLKSAVFVKKRGETVLLTHPCLGSRPPDIKLFRDVRDVGTGANRAPFRLQAILAHHLLSVQCLACFIQSQDILMVDVHVS
jgi:hypothetical protein